MRTSEIADLVGGVLVGDGDREVDRASALEFAGERDISFVANSRYARLADTTRAGTLIVEPDFAITRTDIAFILSEDPYRAFLKVVARLVPPPPIQPPGIHPTAVVASDVRLGDSVSIGPHVVIEQGCSIGDSVTLHAGVVLGRDVSLGSNVTIYPNVTLYYRTSVGSNVVIHAGSVIGGDGFGFLPMKDGGWEKIPQVGSVVIEDDVEIGSNTTIDRAMIGVTCIGRGVKIDNLVHVAHNVVVGERTAIAAQTGISGSARIGTDNMIAGQVGIVGHIETADGSIIEAQSGVSKTIRKPGRYFGHPAKEHSQALRQEGALRQLPELLQTIRRLRDRVAALEAALGQPGDDALED